jgi:hypothetical protein
MNMSEEKWVPKRIRRGFTVRRLKKVLSSPLKMLKNVKFWVRSEVSEEFCIFVMGPPRSGTTLTKNTLRAHSDICGVDDETHFFFRKNYVEFRSPGVPDMKMKKAIKEASSVTGLFDGFARVRKQETGASVFLEKTTVHALRLGYILEHFPKGKIVFVVRDPRDCFRSAKNNPGVWNGLPSEDPLAAYLETWKRCVWGYFNHRGSSRICLVKYEDFCRDPEEELERIMDFIGLKLEQRQLDPSMYGRTKVSNRRGLRRLNETVSAKTIGKWKEALDNEEVKRIERLVEKEMGDLGYSLSTEE